MCATVAKQQAETPPEHRFPNVFHVFLVELNCIPTLNRGSLEDSLISRSSRAN